MRLYEYAIIYVPTDDDGNVQRSECQILVEPKVTLASDERAVTLRAAKEIPATLSSEMTPAGAVYEGGPVELDFVQVVVRPF